MKLRIERSSKDHDLYHVFSEDHWKHHGHIFRKDTDEWVLSTGLCHYLGELDGDLTSSLMEKSFSFSSTAIDFVERFAREDHKNA